MKAKSKTETAVNTEEAGSLGELLKLDAGDSSPATINTTALNSYLQSIGISKDHSAYKHLAEDPKRIAKAKLSLNQFKYGTSSAVPLTCKGYNMCPIKSECWFTNRNNLNEPDPDNSVYPLMERCPVETSILQMKIQHYVHVHCPDVANIDPVTMGLICKMAEIDLYEIRASSVLADGDVNQNGRDLLLQTVEAMNQQTGEVILYGTKEHPLLAVKDRFDKQRAAILKQLMATPEAKFNALMKAKQPQNSVDHSSILTEIRNHIKSLEERVEPNTYTYVENVDDADVPTIERSTGYENKKKKVANMLGNPNFDAYEEED